MSGLVQDTITQVVATSEENRGKNRKENIVPHDNNRVILRRGGDAKKSDYINASHVKGLVAGMNYIVTQVPMLIMQVKACLITFSLSGPPRFYCY